MREYVKVDSPADFPAMCFCGSQKGPLVDTDLVKDRYGHIYVCMRCGTRIGRALGLVKGAEHERLEHAAEELIHASREIETRQEIIDRQTASLAENAEKIRVQAEYIEQLQGDLELRRKQVGQIAEMAAA